MAPNTRKAKTTAGSEVELMVQMIDEAYNRQTWHGTNFRGSLMRVTPEMAAWRPGKGRHNIWENVIHVAYYKYVLWRRLSGQKRGVFPYKADKAWGDWFVRPDRISEKSWKTDLAILKEYHELLREFVAQINPTRDKSIWPKIRRQVIGAAYHDVYHTGQIQLVKRMWKEKNK